MTTQEIITTIIQMVIAPLLIYAVLLARNYILAKIKSAQVERAILLATDAVTAAVGEAGQTFADTIKAEQGYLTAEQARTAFDQALSNARKILGAGGVDLLKTVTEDVNTYLAAKIEEEVRRTRVHSEKPIEI